MIDPEVRAKFDKAFVEKHITGRDCTLGNYFYQISPIIFQQIIGAVPLLTFYVLSGISVVGTIYGVRWRIYVTLAGDNAALR